jgi:hypothetical protein
LNAATEVEHLNFILRNHSNFSFIMANQNANAAMAVEVVPTEGTADVQVQVNDADSQQTKSRNDIIREMIADGWTRKRNIRVRNVITKPISDEYGDTYYRVVFNTRETFPCHITDEDSGERTLSTGNNVFTSLYQVIGTMRDDEQLGCIANRVLENPKVLETFIQGGEIDVLYKNFEEGDEYTNPFSSNDSEPTVFDKDMVVFVIVGIKPGLNGQDTLKMMRQETFMRQW